MDLSISRTSGLKTRVFMAFLKGLGVLLFGAFFVVALHNTVPKPLFLLLEVLVGGAPIYFPVIGLFLLMRTNSQIKQKISRTEKMLEKARRDYAESEAYLSQNAEVEIPPRFRSEQAIDYMIRGLKAREFISLDQALFRCEEAMARNEIPNRYLDF